MKKCNMRNTFGCMFAFKGPYLWCKNSLDDIANLEILPYGLHFSEVMSITKIIKDIDG